MTPAKFKTRRERILALDRALKKLFPNVSIELRFGSTWELLVAVELSAQCTDKMVNRITEKLFARYTSLEDYVRAGKSAKGVGEFEQMVRSCGYYRSKTKNILAAAKMVKEEFGGEVPRTMAEIVRIPGVARKTATVVLSTAFGIVEGVTVDTHVIRFVQRYDLSDYKDPIRIERDLMELLPKKEWAHFTHRVIHYGRYVAPARAYDVSKDPLVKIYPAAANRFRT